MVFEFTYNTHRCPWLIINSFWGLFGVLATFLGVLSDFRFYTPSPALLGAHIPTSRKDSVDAVHKKLPTEVYIMKKM